MFDIIKKIFSFLSVLPAFTGLFNKAKTTGKIDPVETLEALSTISPSTKKCADTAKDTINRGGGVADVADALKNVGEVEVMGQKLNTRTMVQDLRKVGGICGVFANLLDNLPKQNPKDIVDMGNAATDINNWKDIVENVSK